MPGLCAAAGASSPGVSAVASRRQAVRVANFGVIESSLREYATRKSESA
jgi:hypothetical protein